MIMTTQIHGNPNTAISDRICDLFKDANISSRTPEEWARMRRRAFEENNLLDATAITCAQYKVSAGSIDAVDARVLQILGEPGSLLRTDEQWRDMRAAAWTKNDVKEAAALTYAFLLLTYKSRFRAEH